jgi:hypothetical protein
MIGSREEKGMKVINMDLKGAETGGDAEDFGLGDGTFRLSSLKGRVIWLIFWEYL